MTQPIFLDRSIVEELHDMQLEQFGGYAGIAGWGRP